jgi:hypothetical protein
LRLMSRNAVAVRVQATRRLLAQHSHSIRNKTTQRIPFGRSPPGLGPSVGPTCVRLAATAAARASVASAATDRGQVERRPGRRCRRGPHASSHVEVRRKQLSQLRSDPPRNSWIGERSSLSTLAVENLGRQYDVLRSLVGASVAVQRPMLSAGILKALNSTPSRVCTRRPASTGRVRYSSANRRTRSCRRTGIEVASEIRTRR